MLLELITDSNSIALVLTCALLVKILSDSHKAGELWEVFGFKSSESQPPQQDSSTPDAAAPLVWAPRGQSNA
jgi:hypothetical protein